MPATHTFLSEGDLHEILQATDKARTTVHVPKDVMERLINEHASLYQLLPRADRVIHKGERQ